MKIAKYFIVPYCCSFYVAGILIMKALGGNKMELTDIITTAASIAVPIIVSIIAFAAATKSGNNATEIAKIYLSKEHIEIKNGQNEIKSGQNQIQNGQIQIQNGQSELKTVVSAKLDKINEYVTEERTRRTFLDNNQEKINDNINALLNNWKQVNAENARLKEENIQLRHKIDELFNAAYNVKPTAHYEQSDAEAEEEQ